MSSTAAFQECAVAFLQARSKGGILGIRVLSVAFLWASRVGYLSWLTACALRFMNITAPHKAVSRVLELFDFRLDSIFSGKTDTRKEAKSALGGLWTATLFACYFLFVYWSILAFVSPSGYRTHTQYEPIDWYQGSIPLTVLVTVPTDATHGCAQITSHIESSSFSQTSSIQQTSSGANMTCYESAGVATVSFQTNVSPGFKNGGYLFNVTGYAFSSAYASVSVTSDIVSYTGNGGVTPSYNPLNLPTPTLITFMDSCLLIDNLQSSGDNTVFIPASLRRNCFGGVAGPRPYCSSNFVPGGFFGGGKFTEEYSLASLAFNSYESGVRFQNQSSLSSNPTAASLVVLVFFAQDEILTMTEHPDNFAPVLRIFVGLLVVLMVHPFFRRAIAVWDAVASRRLVDKAGVTRMTGLILSLKYWVVILVVSYGRAVFVDFVAFAFPYGGIEVGAVSPIAVNTGYLIFEFVLSTIAFFACVLGFVAAIIGGIFWLGGGAYIPQEDSELTAIGGGVAGGIHDNL